MRVWGRYTVERDQPLIQVERYETAYPDQRVQAWLGTVEIATVEGREMALFQSREGERYVLASSLRHPDLDWYRQAIGSHQVLHEGVVRPETLGGYPVIEELSSRWGGDVDRMTGLEDYQQVTGAPVQVVRPEESPLPGQAFVEQVELVYYAVRAVDIVYASGPPPDPSLRVVQPVWRFAGAPPSKCWSRPCATSTCSSVSRTKAERGDTALSIHRVSLAFPALSSRFVQTFSPARG